MSNVARPAAVDDMRVLRARGQALAQVRDDQASQGASDVLVCQVRGERYAIQLDVLRSVQRSDGLTRVPCAPPQVAGILNVRGELLSVLELGAALGLDAPPASTHTQVLLVELAHARIGLLVEEVLGIERLALDRLDGSVSGAPYSRGVANGHTVVLNLEQLLASDRFDARPQATSTSTGET